METLKFNDPWNKMFRKGITLWRHCTLRDGQVVVNDIQFDRTEQQTLVGRLTLHPNGIWEPEIISVKEGDRFNKGVVVFVDELPPPQWTHLVLSGVSKPFTEPGKPERGGCVFAKIAVPYDFDKYIKFRHKMFEIHGRDAAATIDEAARLSGGIWIDEKREEESRLVVQRAWTNEAYFNFSEIK